MNTTEAITKIMELGGVPRSDFHLVRPKLEKLSPPEIEGRLATLTNREQRFAEWRKVRGAAVPRNMALELLKAEQIGKLAEDHPILPKHQPLTRLGITEALARIESALVRFRPDVLVAVNAENQAIAELLADDLNLDVPVIVCSSSLDTLDWLPVRPVKNAPSHQPEIVCVVGHTAFSGETHARILKEARSHFGTEKVYGAALAASAEAAARTAFECSLVFRHLVEDPFAFPRHAASSEFRIKSRWNPLKDTEYILTFADKHIAVSKLALRQARNEMSELFPQEREPWLPTAVIR